MSSATVSTHPHPLPTINSPISLGLTLLLAGITFSASFSARLLSVSQPIFVVGYVAIFLAFISLMLNDRLTVKRKNWLGFFALLFAAWLIPVMLQEHVYPDWLIGDIAQYTAPILLYFVAASYPKLFSKRMVNIYILALIIGAFVATLFVGNTDDDEGRYQAPRAILFGFTWWWVFHGKNMSVKRVAAIAFVLALFVLAWESTVRAATVLWLVMGGLVYLTRVKRISYGLIYMIAGVLIIVAVLGGLLVKSIEESRFGKIDYSSIQDSKFIVGRALETEDAWKYYWQHATAVQVIIGYGPGGSFKVDKLYAMLQTINLEKGRVNADGFAHIIHFGPTRLLFRWGLTGIAIFIIFGSLLFRDWFVLRRTGRLLGEDYLFPTFYFGALGTYMRYFIYPVENEWDFAYMMVGYLIVRQIYMPVLRNWDRGIRTEQKYLPPPADAAASQV